MNFNLDDTRKKPIQKLKELINGGVMTLDDAIDWLRTIYEIRFFEEKVKTLTSFFSILLEMRKEITKNLKEEIELRRKTSVDDKLGSIEEYLDIRGFASKVEDFRKRKEKLQKKREKSTKKDMEEVDNLVTIRESG